MTQTYNINPYDGHLIITEQGKLILVDTGSPFTLARETEFTFMGITRHVARTNIGQTVEDLSELMGFQFDVLLGMDVMSALSVLVDYKDQKLTFSDEGLDCDGFSKLSMGGNAGAVSISLSVNGGLLNFALDTGAKISYIDHRLTSGLTPVEERDDFYPVLGHFTTPIYDMQAQIGDSPFPVKFGNLPTSLSMPLKMFGIDGIIGYDLFSAFTIIMDFRHGTLLYKVRND